MLFQVILILAQRIFWRSFAKLTVSHNKEQFEGIRKNHFQNLAVMKTSHFNGHVIFIHQITCVPQIHTLASASVLKSVEFHGVSWNLFLRPFIIPIDRSLCPCSMGHALISGHNLWISNNDVFKWCSFVYLWILMVVIEFLYIDVFRWPLMNDVISMPSGSWTSKGMKWRQFEKVTVDGCLVDDS